MTFALASAPRLLLASWRGADWLSNVDMGVSRGGDGGAEVGVAVVGAGDAVGAADGVDAAPSVAGFTAAVALCALAAAICAAVRRGARVRGCGLLSSALLLSPWLTESGVWLSVSDTGNPGGSRYVAKGRMYVARSAQGTESPNRQ